MITPEPLVIQGEVEATEIRVSAKISGRVDGIYVKEGDTVKESQLLITIESPELEAKLEQANAAKTAAAAQKDKAENGTRREKIVSARNLWLKAQAAEHLANKTYQRIETLYTEGVLPAQKKDEAQAGFIAAQSATRSAKAGYDMAVQGARDEDKTAARALMDKAQGAVEEVESYLKETRLKAPVEGEIACILPERGELITPGFPLVTIIDLDDVWVTFNLKETLLADIRMGSQITARIPALGNKEISLEIIYIKALGEYATWHATKASGDFDLKTFEVRGLPVTKSQGLRPGMSAIVNWN